MDRYFNVDEWNMKIARWAVLLLLFPWVSNATSFIDLEARNKLDTASQEGKDYEAKVVNIFFGDKKFMSTCFPENGPVPDPVKIYFEITPKGTLGELKINPGDDAAKCIKKNLKVMHFPKPENKFIAKITLKFKD